MVYWLFDGSYHGDTAHCGDSAARGETPNSAQTGTRPVRATSTLTTTIMNSTQSRLFLLLVLIGFTLSSSFVHAETLFGLDMSNRIYTFDSATPSSITFLNSGLPITGLAAGETLLGIDFRPVATNSPAAASNGVLYALGLTNRLYTISTTTGSASPVGAAGAFTLSGNAFGLDFNPVPDRLRVLSELDQNLRLNPNDGTLTSVDTPLGYAVGDPGFGANPNVVGAAYTNNFGGATQSTLYGIDSARDVLVLIGGLNGSPSPNGGQLTDRRCARSEHDRRGWL
jgi:hypothetical protein